jgi:hypothetical protein
MKKLLLLPILGLVLGIGLSCKTPSLETGGAYKPTNELGQVIYNDVGLAMADASYKLAYDTIISVLKFEKDNRAHLFEVSPTICLDVKHAMDKVRVQTWQIEQRWALARRAYRASPTPAGMTTLQTILAEIQRIIPVVQSQLNPVYQTLTSPTK